MGRICIGGGTYAPWRGTFHPDALPQKRALEYASRQHCAIKVDGTYSGAQIFRRAKARDLSELA